MSLLKSDFGCAKYHDSTYALKHVFLYGSKHYKAPAVYVLDPRNHVNAVKTSFSTVFTGWLHSWVATLMGGYLLGGYTPEWPHSWVAATFLGAYTLGWLQSWVATFLGGYTLG